MPDQPTHRARVPAARVDYSAHLSRVARTDSWNWIHQRKRKVPIWAGILFFAAAFFVWLVRGAEVDFLVPIFSGFVAVMLADLAVFAMHLLYLTPQKLCAIKQRQLEEERRKFAAALEKEKQDMQAVVAELNALKAKMQEHPLQPLELREEIGQLIAEGEVLLDAVETTMIAEADLWFEDVERFSKRHLNSGQYDHLHAVNPPDIEEQVKFHRAVSEDAPVGEEEFAVAERLIRITTGLKELREEISGGTARKPAMR